MMKKDHERHSTRKKLDQPMNDVVVDLYCFRLQTHKKLRQKDVELPLEMKFGGFQIWEVEQVKEPTLGRSR